MALHPKGSIETPVLIPQPHGGALLDSGAPGNRGGTGRPPSIVRSLAREAWADRTPILTAIADGHVMNKVKVPLSAVLRHARCPKCRTPLKAKAPQLAEDVTLEGAISASAGERVRAMSELSKVGLGPALSHDDVRERVRQMLQILMARELWTREDAINAIEGVWK